MFPRTAATLPETDVTADVIIGSASIARKVVWVAVFSVGATEKVEV